MDWHYQQNTNMPGTGVPPLIPNYSRITPAISWVEKWITEDMEVEAGVRYEFIDLKVKRIDAQNQLVKPEFQFHNISGSVGIRIGLSDDIIVFSHSGITHRAPHVDELFSEGLHHGAAAIERGDTNLVTEKAFKWVSGIEFKKPAWYADLSIFVQRIGDFIYLQPTGEPELTIRGAFPVFQYAQDDVRLLGSEGSVQFTLARNWNWRSEFSIIRARNISLDEGLIGIPSDRMRHTLQWDNERHKIDAEISLEHVWEQTRVPDDSDYAAPPAAYSLVHAGMGFSMLNDQLAMHLSVRNLFNVSYREYLNRLRYYADDTGRSIELRLYLNF
jgi:iron complex outermembrane receptor protein